MKWVEDKVKILKTEEECPQEEKLLGGGIIGLYLLLNMVEKMSKCLPNIGTIQPRTSAPTEQRDLTAARN
jgi:hypothetical protein